jgi:hypothetical protein
MRAVIAVLALLLLAPIAGSTQVVRLSLPDLVDRAALVVEGRCLSVKTERDARGVIVSEVSLYVDRGRKGAQDGQVLTFQMPGGELAGKRLMIPGLPTFAPGDEVFLFLTEPSLRGWRMPVGLGQGLYRMSVDASTSQRRLVRDLTGLELVDAVTGQGVDAPTRQELAYRTLVDEVERLLAEDR